LMSYVKTDPIADRWWGGSSYPHKCGRKLL